MAELVLERLEKRFGNTLAVDRLDLAVLEGELVTLLGPSGSGKTSVLRLIAGFLTPDFGRILVDGTEVQELAPEKRDIGMVFQNYALFPHRSVQRNVAFGLERRRIARDERDRRVRAALAMVRLEDLAERFPSELSGGQQQRMALARALVIEPRLLLLDEPLSSLDARLREGLREEIRRLQRELEITTLLVTHDQEEALGVSDRVALINQGRLEQVGAPGELYHRPKNRFVAEFLGKVNLLPALQVSRNEDGFASYRLTAGDVVRGRASDATETRVLLAVRPEAMFLEGTEGGSRNRLDGVLRSRRFLGPVEEWEVALPSGTSIVLRGNGNDLYRAPAAPREGERVTLSWSPTRTWPVPDLN